MMASQWTFDPDRVAYYEKAGWEAYYARNWPRVLWLMVQLNRQQFAMSLPVALVAAYDTIRAAAAFAPLNNDLPKTRCYLTRFYQRARRTVGMQADAATLAALELDYWIVHRQLAEQRKQNHDDADIALMVDSLARLHAALFDATPEQMRISAMLRALAAVAVDRITGKYSSDVALDWERVESLLHQAYRAVILIQRRSDSRQL